MDPRDPRRIPPGAKGPVTSRSPIATGPSDWHPPPGARPLYHSQSSPTTPPSLRTGYYATRTPYAADSSRSKTQSRSSPRSGAQASNGNNNLKCPSQPTEIWQFPEPQIVRSYSHQSSLQPPQVVHRPRPHSSQGVHPTEENFPTLRHKYSYSDGRPPSRAEREAEESFERSPSIAPSFMSDEFANLSLGEAAEDGLASIDGLARFQNGEGDSNDWAWHKLVTKEARESLPMPEVMRQSAIFDLISGERGYVNDLELVQQVFKDGLRQTPSPVIPSDRLEGFVREVFWNMDLVLAHHQRMLASLFHRQQEQHPILLSIGDLVLDTVLKFQTEYDSYIQHYPLAESLHRRELKSNAVYQAFLEKCSQDPRLGKRDLITFISRPVTRLPRLSLQLAEVKKRTERLNDSGGEGGLSLMKEDHPDLETIPIVVDVLDRFVKSTQPGIEASEGKAKFYALCESLRYRKGEIIDMDLYNENRTLVHFSPLARKQRSETWNGWADLEVELLDNYVLITKPDARSGNKDVVSRPIPLEYLCLGPFNVPPENRREERSEGGGLLESFIKPTRPVFPLVIYHASSPARRYTLYANTEASRTKWKDAFENALGLRKVVNDANKWFVMNLVNDGFFRSRSPLVPAAYPGLFTGRISSAVIFSSGGKNIVVVATPVGVFANVRGQLGPYVKVLNLSSIPHMSALQGFNKILIQHDGSLLAYSLDLIARVAQGQAPHKSLDLSMERLANPARNGNVSFFRVGVVAGRTLVVYACKSFMNFTLHALEAIIAQPGVLHQSQSQSKSLFFRPYGEAFYVPKEPFDVTLLVKTIAVCTDRSIAVVDPINLTGQPPVPIPDFGELGRESPYDSPMAALKAKCDYSKPIGIVRCAKEELIVIYDEFGCYVTKYGVPTRKCGFVRWETKATSYAERAPHILLFSQQFIEVRHVSTGRLVQVIEGRAIRPVQTQIGVPLLIAMKGEKDDKQGQSDELVELVETAPIEQTPLTPATTIRRGTRHSTNDGANPLWEEWE